jgi:hypothetical protein
VPMQRHGLAVRRLGGFCSQPCRAGLPFCACPLPRCEIERNFESCRAGPTRSARWPARVNLAAFWQQIAPIVPFLPTLPTGKCCAVCYLQIAVHLDTEEVAGSNPVVPTKIRFRDIRRHPVRNNKPLINQRFIVFLRPEVYRGSHAPVGV